MWIMCRKNETDENHPEIPATTWNQNGHNLQFTGFGNQVHFSSIQNDDAISANFRYRYIRVRAVCTVQGLYEYMNEYERLFGGYVQYGRTVVKQLHHHHHHSCRPTVCLVCDWLVRRLWVAHPFSVGPCSTAAAAIMHCRLLVGGCLCSLYLLAAFLVSSNTANVGCTATIQAAHQRDSSSQGFRLVAGSSTSDSILTLRHPQMNVNGSDREVSLSILIKHFFYG